MQGFDDQKFKILTAAKIFKFFLDQFTIFLSIELHTEEAFSPQNKTSSTSKHEIFK
jgi:hypothetical protein